MLWGGCFILIGGRLHYWPNVRHGAIQWLNKSVYIIGAENFARTSFVAFLIILKDILVFFFSSLSANKFFSFWALLLPLLVPPDKIIQCALARDADEIFSASILLCYQFCKCEMWWRWQRIMLCRPQVICAKDI